MKTGNLTLHPFLFAAYPVFYLYARNSGLMPWTDVLAPLAVALAATAVLLLIFLGCLRSIHAGAALTTLALLIFTAYRPAYVSIKHLGLVSDRSIIHQGLIIFVVLSLACAAFLLLRFRRNLSPLNSALNTFGLCLLLLNVWDFGASILHGEGPAMRSRSASIFPTVALPHSAARPNIYYIIMDGYGRHDVLKDIYKYDNATFLEALRELGFYVASGSHANYAQTLLSFSSSLNMDYLDRFAAETGEASRDRSKLRELVSDNKVSRSLRSAGYKWISFASGYSGTDVRRSDLRIETSFSLSEFGNVLMRLTPLPWLQRAIPITALQSWQFEAHRKRIRNTLTALPELAVKEAGPFFALAHVIAPHPPFVFKAGGQASENRRIFSFHDGSHFVKRWGRKRYVRGYAEQIKHISSLLQQTLSDLRRNDPDAVIIVQGDHGPGSRLDWNNHEKSDARERLAVLNAYYGPARMIEALYPGISPVNSFRVVFNALFNTSLPLLEDEAYLSTWKGLYRFRNVTQTVKSPAGE